MIAYILYGGATPVNSYCSERAGSGNFRHALNRFRLYFHDR